ncbi:30S ribosomal protein S15 [Spiroplasma sabaudiense Ar-1343]|uniref:Small ribosomal subunit protein uS15 n=1 Tax=Spiroplasma sabaudiense Ar-1343 TaxID=1276257 RepID=W6AA74_9MOLU|nr:30S ribosomal protein S15 [Spiroplasma sabaudiense]AHI53967.1 30S ribosomal protein S15 [Spiroplasma sabaudiense Ar-1343]
MVSKTKKAQIIKEFGKNEKDTGLAEVQIALLTDDIKNLTEHLQLHKKDITSRRSLLKKVSQRKHHLNFLIRNDFERYKGIISKLNLRK